MTGVTESASSPMQIALICPFSFGPGRGNITTVRRIADHLPAAGCRTTSINLDSMNTEKRNELLAQSGPDLLHAFHAYHAGPTARQASLKLGIPYLITITGSDLFDSKIRNAPETRQTLIDAAAVTCFDSLVAQRLEKVFPHISGRLSVIPQGVAPFPVQNPFPDPDNNFHILLPAVLRPVKGITNAIEALNPLAQEFPSLRLLVVGGAIDADYADKISEMAAALPWVQLLGDVPYQQMGSIYAAANLVLNSSVFEGGMANALLEAMAMGKPVLASDVLGNRSLIKSGENGWLYQNNIELQDIVRLLLGNPGLGKRIGIAGKYFVEKNCSPKVEANSYAALYRRLLERK